MGKSKNSLSKNRGASFTGYFQKNTLGLAPKLDYFKDALMNLTYNLFRYTQIIKK